MSFWKRLFGSDTGGDTSPSPPLLNPTPDGWGTNENGLPTLTKGSNFFTVYREDTYSTPLWRYCAVLDDGVEFSHLIPTEALAKRAAELHAKIGKRPEFGIVELEPSEDDYFDVVGESNYQEALEKIAGPKQASGADISVEAILIPEPENEYDKHAIMVIIDDQKVGYIPKDKTRPLHSLFTRAGATNGICEAFIEGGWKNSRSEGHYCVRLDIEWPPHVKDE